MNGWVAWEETCKSLPKHCIHQAVYVLFPGRLHDVKENVSLECFNVANLCNDIENMISAYYWIILIKGIIFRKKAT